MGSMLQTYPGSSENFTYKVNNIHIYVLDRNKARIQLYNVLYLDLTNPLGFMSLTCEIHTLRYMYTYTSFSEKVTPSEGQRKVIFYLYNVLHVNVTLQ